MSTTKQAVLAILAFAYVEFGAWVANVNMFSRGPNQGMAMFVATMVAGAVVAICQIHKTP